MALGNPAKPETGEPMQGNISKRQLRAIAYQLADEIQTRADALMRADASLTRERAIALAVDDMAKA
jgi:hypothetical protein